MNTNGHKIFLIAGIGDAGLETHQLGLTDRVIVGIPHRGRPSIPFGAPGPSLPNHSGWATVAVAEWGAALA
jgi:hypothetical protein